MEGGDASLLGFFPTYPPLYTHTYTRTYARARIDGSDTCILSIHTFNNPLKT